MHWEHRDPSNASFRTSNVYGYVNDGTDHNPAELDPLGADSGIANPYLIDPEPPDENPSLLPYPSFSDPRHPGSSYSVDGVRVPADYFRQLVDIGWHGSAAAMARAAAGHNYTARPGKGPGNPNERSIRGFGGLGAASRLGVYASSPGSGDDKKIPDELTFEVTIPIPPDPISRIGELSRMLDLVQTMPQNYAQDRSDLKADRHVFQNKKPNKHPGLPDCVKNYLSKFFDRAHLDKITWSHGIPWYVPGGNDNGGFTSGDHVYFGTRAWITSDGIQPREILLVGHEVAHSRQYRFRIECEVFD